MPRANGVQGLPADLSARHRISPCPDSTCRRQSDVLRERSHHEGRRHAAARRIVCILAGRHGEQRLDDGVCDAFPVRGAEGRLCGDGWNTECGLRCGGADCHETRRQRTTTYTEANRTVVRRTAAKSSLYALYVLALAGKPEQSVMSFYRNERSLLTTDTRYLLAGAYALSGDRRALCGYPARRSLPWTNPRRTNGGSFDSPVRSAAVMLNVLLESDLNSPHVPRLMEYLSKALPEG